MPSFRLLPRCVKALRFNKKTLSPSQVQLSKIKSEKYCTFEIFSDQPEDYYRRTFDFILKTAPLKTPLVHNLVVDELNRRFTELQKLKNCQSCFFCRGMTWKWMESKSSDGIDGEDPDSDDENLKINRSDLAIWCPKDEIDIYANDIKQVPILVIEVLSPGNYLKDLIEVRDLYANVGVLYYGIVHPFKGVANFGKRSVRKATSLGEEINKACYVDLKKDEEIQLDDNCNFNVTDFWTGPIIPFHEMEDFTHRWFNEKERKKK